jgi:serine/threonine protein kinase
MSSDRNLLFGIVAVQMNFITRDALIQAMNSWILEKHRPLADILIQHGQLTAERRQLLDALVSEHLKAHGNDPQKSLAALSSVEEIARSLKKVADADVQQSLAGIPESALQPTTTFAPREAGIRFRVLRPHAQGGLGEVFVAEDLELHREVALKEIQPSHANNPNSRGRFLMEAEVTGGLEHPGIVPVYGLGNYADGRPFYAMRFIRGDSLKEAIERFHGTAGQVQTARDGFDSIAFRQLLRRFQDVCNAIAYAHSRGILHRDLKPGNIMLGMYGETLVVDWGLAKPIGRDHTTELTTDIERTLQPVSGSGYVETQMGSVIGTPGYMSPEQASGRLEDLGPASDIYSLGATLYVLVTGQPPFQGPVPEVLKKVEGGDFAAPRQLRPDVPPALNAIVVKAMSRKREDRYPTATALADEIDRFLADEAVSAYREPFVVRARRWGRKHRTFVTSATATALVLLVVSIVGAVVLGDKNRLLAQTNDRLDTANATLTHTNDRLDTANAALTQTNVDLVLARTDADAKRVIAEKARETTAEQRQLALDTVRDVLLRVDEQMKRDSRLMEIRLGIIRLMADDVDRIRDHALKNPLEDRTEAIAHLRMGEIYFKANRIQDADEWLIKAYVILKKLADEEPDNPAYLRNFSFVSHQLAEAKWRLGNGKKARQLHGEALRLSMKRQALVEANGTEMEKADAAHDVADAYQNVAYTDLRLGDPKTAVQNYHLADDAFAKLPPPLPNWLKIRRMRNEIQVRLGDAESKLRNVEQAQKHYLQALADREAMFQATPAIRANSSNANLLKTDIGQSRMYLGDFYLMIRKDYKAADEQYRMSLQLFSEVLKAEPDSLDVLQRVAATHYRLGITAPRWPLLPLLGNIGDVVHFPLCLAMRQDLARIDPKDTQGQVEVLLAYARLGRNADVEATAARLLEQAGADPQSLFQTVCGFSICAGGRGEAANRCRDAAFKTMERLLASGWKDPVALETDPDLDAIRGDPRFVEMLKRFK